MGELKLNKWPDDIVMKQSCASVGQGILMSHYHNTFSKYKIKVAQVLISYDTLENKKTLVNMKNNLNRLLSLGVIPIINENDAISTEEIGKTFGDNDMMSVKVAVNTKADLLILLTNVDGLYNKNPKDKNAVLIREVKKIDGHLLDLSGKSKLGVGGMKSKVKAAQIATSKGIKVIIANGRKKSTLIKLLKGKREGTVFLAK